MSLLQASETLDDERILFDMDDPNKLVYKSTVRGALFLASINNVLESGRADWIRRTEGTARRKLTSEFRRFTARTMNGCPVTEKAIDLAAECGADETFDSSWLRIAPKNYIKQVRGVYHAVEFEEVLPYVEAVPSTSAVLGLLTPARLDSPLLLGIWADVSKVSGRKGISDAYYSLISMGVDPEIGHTNFGIHWPTPPREYVVNDGYRGVPTDGQFTSIDAGSDKFRVMFRLDTARQSVRAMDLHTRRSRWKWHYEWMVPYTNDKVVEDYVNRGYTPPPVDLEDAIEQEEMYDAPTPDRSRHIDNPPEAEMHQRELLGDAWGDISTAHAAVMRVAGKQVSKTEYEALARSLAGAVTALDIEMCVSFMPQDTAQQMLTQLHNFSLDAAGFVDANTTANQCLDVARKARELLVTPVAGVEDETVPSCPKIEELPTLDEGAGSDDESGDGGNGHSGEVQSTPPEPVTESGKISPIPAPADLPPAKTSTEEIKEEGGTTGLQGADASTADPKQETGPPPQESSSTGTGQQEGFQTQSVKFSSEE